MEQTEEQKDQAMDNNFFTMRSVDDDIDELAVGKCYRTTILN